MSNFAKALVGAASSKWGQGRPTKTFEARVGLLKDNLDLLKEKE